MKLGALKSPALAWFLVIVGGLMWCVGLLELIFGEENRLSGLPLVVMMTWSITVGVLSLINQRRRWKGLPEQT